MPYFFADIDIQSFIIILQLKVFIFSFGTLDFLLKTLLFQCPWHCFILFFTSQSISLVMVSSWHFFLLQIETFVSPWPFSANILILRGLIYLNASVFLNTESLHLFFFEYYMYIILNSKPQNNIQWKISLFFLPDPGLSSFSRRSQLPPLVIVFCGTI